MGKKWAYYNDSDAGKCAWTRELMRGGVIAAGEVDERRIGVIEPEDLKGFVQCHFFCGISAWSYALREAGWGDDRAVWTGSCPCQAFSMSGKREGLADERHLWPEWGRLIEACRPPVIFGEQVASASVIGPANMQNIPVDQIGFDWGNGNGFVGEDGEEVDACDGEAWLDVVFAQLEAASYTCGAVVIPACGFGAPHIRSRLFFVAHAEAARREVRDGSEFIRGTDGGTRAGSEQGGATGGLADNHGERPGALNGYWQSADWIRCRDGRWRPVERLYEPLSPGTADLLGFGSDPGIPGFWLSPLQSKGKARVMRLRGYGDSLCVPAAIEFVRAYRLVCETGT